MDVAQLIFTRMKRRVVLTVAFFLAGICILVTSFIPKEYSWAVVICFLIGKSLLGFSSTALYMYTAEQYPTNVRTTILNTESMIGRIGSMLAPYVVILVRLAAHRGVLHFFFMLNVWLLFSLAGQSIWFTSASVVQRCSHFHSNFITVQSGNISEKTARHYRRSHRFVNILRSDFFKIIIW